MQRCEFSISHAVSGTRVFNCGRVRMGIAISRRVASSMSGNSCGWLSEDEGLLWTVGSPLSVSVGRSHHCLLRHVCEGTVRMLHRRMPRK